MRKLSSLLLVFAISVATSVLVPQRLFAAEPFNPISWLTETIAGDQSKSCDHCGQPHCAGECIERIPVKKCVTGKKKVYDCKTCYEYVTIPEIKHRWVKRRVTKEIPCPYCKPVCKTKEKEYDYYTEKWEKIEDKCCSELHCKTCEPQTEKVECKYCDRAKGETTIKVHYWTCVKEPYTVYRQVKRPVCVKQPRYVHVKVPITKHVCNHCGGHGCDHCGK